MAGIHQCRDLAWAAKRGIRIDFIQPGNPQQNAYVECYNRTVRYDWLAHHPFETLDEVQDFATRWLWTYNHDRPDMALGGIKPKWARLVNVIKRDNVESFLTQPLHALFERLLRKTLALAPSSSPITPP